ncbi:MAG: hypothetical protein WD024_02620 [Bacillota bacterium]
MRHPLRPLTVILIALVLLMSDTLGPFPGPASASSLDPALRIAGRFPDRKTSSYDSQQLVSYLRGQLEARGWKTETQAYSLLVRSGEPGALDTSFVHVSGENALAYRVAPSATDPVDLLLVAPYDVLVEEPSGSNDISYSARATDALLSLASNLSPSQPGLAFSNLAVAFVSGHYQYGAGIAALLDELTTKRGATVKAALVIGDIDALDSIPVTVGSDTPTGLAQAVYRSANSSGARVTLVGPDAREAWYKAVMRPQSGALSVESMFDKGAFPGEASVLLERGIPALTLGTPRNNLSLPLDPPTQSKIDQVVSTLLDFLGSSALQDAVASPTVGDSVAVQAFGHLAFVPRRTASIAGVAGALAAVLALALVLRHRKDLTPLALLGGVLLALTAGYPMKSLWVGAASRTYSAVVSPGKCLFLYVWSGVTFVMLGFFRIWRIRTRIAHLRSRIPAPEAPATARPAAGNWAGPWGLAATAAVLLGTSLLGSEIGAAALVATVGLSLAVLLDHPDRFGKATTLAIRFLGSLAVLPLVLWAGSPFSRDPARMYSLSIVSIGVEAISFTISLAVFVACLVSSFRLPAPVPPRMMKFVTLAELGVVAILICVGLLVPKAGADALPARALVREFLGSEARVTVDTTRLLGDLNLLPGGVQPKIAGVPARLSSRSLTETIRLGVAKAPAAWAEVSQSIVSADKGKEVTDVTGMVAAVFKERPTYYRLTFQDVALSKNTTSAFQLHDLPAVLGTEGRVPPPNTEVNARTGYSITATWWMPREAALTQGFHITFAPVTSRVDVTGWAVYLDRSYIGLAPFAPSTPNAGFVLVTNVTGQSSYR